MGKTLSRYLLKSFWSTLVLIILIFVFLVFFADIMDNLDDFISYKLPLIQYLNYYLCTAPTVFIICLPFAVLLSSMRLFRNLSSSNEYIALIMSGIPLRKIIIPILMSTVILSCISFYLTDKVAPSTRFKRKVMQKDKFKINVQTIKNKNLIGVNGEKYYINRYEKNKKIINGLMVTYSDLDNAIKKRIFAERVIWSGKKWEGEKIKIIPYKKNGLPDKPKLKEKMTFPTLFHPSELILSKTSPNFLSIKSLKSLIKSIPEEQNKMKAGLLLDYYRKFSISLLPIIILFIAIPFSIAPVRTASSKTIGIGILLSLSYYILDAFCYQAGKGMLVPPVFAAWMPNAIFLGLSVFLFKKVPR